MMMNLLKRFPNQKMTIVLGIESTAHTFGIGVVRNGKILSNVRDMYSTKSGGIIPLEAARHHKKISKKIYEKSLKEAKISEKQIDAIAFSQGPGLAPCLIEGMKFSKELSKKLDKPLVPVNHCIAHLEIGGSLKKVPKDPVMLYASGANTQVIAYASGKYRVFGETLDIGVGNFIDTFARYAGIGFPGGPLIEKLALGETPLAYPEKSSKKIFTRGKYIELPYRVKGMDVAFSGILTNLRQKLDSKEYTLNDLAFSLQETIFAMLVETAERAMAHTDKKELLLGGGVACNSRLQEMCEIMCKERKAKFFCPEKSLLVDNGAMIAFLGEIMFKVSRHQLPNHPPFGKNKKSVQLIYFPKNLDKIDIKPRQRTDDIIVSWK